MSLIQMALFLKWWPERPAQRDPRVALGSMVGGRGACLGAPVPSSAPAWTGLGGRKLSHAGGLHLLLHAAGLERGAESRAGRGAL